MKIPNFGKKVIINKVLKEIPSMVNVIEWLTDPDHPGRKRGISSACSVIAGAMKGMAVAFTAACTGEVLSATVCKFDPNVVASVLGDIAVFLDTIVIPGASTMAVVMGAWGLWSAKKKTAYVKNLMS